MTLMRVHALAGLSGFLLVAVSIWYLGAVGGAQPRSWELHTATQMVAGKAELESGRLDAAIAALVALHMAAPDDEPGAVLTNLCLAYTLKRDYATALDFCDEAIALQAIGRDAYNNRGVLYALTGDYVAAIADFQSAGCDSACPANLVAANTAPSAIVARNLKRARVQLNAMLKESE